MISLAKAVISKGWNAVSKTVTGNWVPYETFAAEAGKFFKSNIGSAVAIAGTGGLASMLTGGSFIQGAIFGGMGGFAGVKVNRNRLRLGKFVSGAPGGEAMRRAIHWSAGTRTRAALGGAALGGVIFGGRSKDKRHGLNAARGARF